MSTTILGTLFLSIVVGQGLGEGLYSFPGLRDEQCETQGLQCSPDCKQIIYCSQSQGVPIVVEECKDKLCNVGNYTCTANSCGNKPAPYEVKCSGQGFFPDAYDCTKSYFCGGSGAPLVECKCAKGDIYDANDENCITSDCCRQNAVKCSNIGQLGGFGSECENSNQFYYVCVHAGSSIVGTVFRCPEGEVFINSEKPDPSKPCGPPVGTQRTNSYFRSLIGKSRGECQTYVSPVGRAS